VLHLVVPGFFARLGATVAHLVQHYRSSIKQAVVSELAPARGKPAQGYEREVERVVNAYFKCSETSASQECRLYYRVLYVSTEYRLG